MSGLLHEMETGAFGLRVPVRTEYSPLIRREESQPSGAVDRMLEIEPGRLSKEAPSFLA